MATSTLLSWLKCLPPSLCCLSKLLVLPNGLSPTLQRPAFSLGNLFESLCSFTPQSYRTTHSFSSDWLPKISCFEEGLFTKDHLLRCCLGVGWPQGIIQSPGLVTVELLSLPGLKKQGEEIVTKTCKERDPYRRLISDDALLCGLRESVSPIVH